ncbi:hypothetical protein D9M70_470160 [compost metagenome]
MLAAAPAEFGQACTFAEGEVRIAQRDQLHLRFRRAVQLAPGAHQVGRHHAQAAPRGQVAERLGGVGRFGGDAGDVKHRCGRGCREGGAEGLEVVEVWGRAFQSADHRNLAATEQAQVVTEQWVEGIVEVFRRRHLDAQRGAATLVAVAAHPRRAAGDGDADVEVVGVLQGPRAEHAVGVHHGIGLGPDHLLAKPRSAVEQVGRTGEAGVRAHRQVGVAERARRLAEFGVDAQFAPAALVHRDRIEGGRHAHSRAPFHQAAGEAQARRAGVDAAVDVRLGDVHQLARALQFGDAQEDAHRHFRGLAMAPFEHLAVALIQLQIACGGEAANLGLGRPTVAGQAVEQLDAAVLDTCGLGTGKPGEAILAQADHRE